jgi:DNA-binding MarR family transcriptional regulator
MSKSLSEANRASKEADALPYSVTLHVRDHCMCLHLQRAARAVARRFDEALRPSGLTNGQFSLLMSLNRPEPPLMRDVAAVLAMDRTSLTAMLKPLAKRGLVEITTDSEDRRGKRVVLTRAGRDCLAAALPSWLATEAAVERDIRGDADGLRDTLRTLT